MLTSCKALRACPAQYRAGAAYADFMPDLLMAQTLVHPDNRGWGNTRSDDWLQRIWARGARAALPSSLTPSSCTQTLAIKAYAVGFMTHAAGDMYGHSYINEFAGGPWDLLTNITPRHLVLEDYIGMRTPDDSPGFYDISIDRVDGMIYDEMLSPGNPSGIADIASFDMRLEDSNLSRLFGGVRRLVTVPIDAYDGGIAAFDRRIADYTARAQRCGAFDFSCSKTWLNAQATKERLAKEGFRLASWPFVAYLRAWRDDIDEGLRAWPAVSFAAHRSAFFHEPLTYQRSPDDILEPWVRDHLLPMTGMPDLAADYIFLDPIKALLPDWVERRLDEMKAGLYEWLVRSALGQQFAEWEAYLTSPQLYFDQVPSLFPNDGCWMSLHDFNHGELMIHDTGYALMDETFDWQEFRPAYNTVTMVKLSLLSRAGLSDLLDDLGSSLSADDATLPVMLGFMNSFDEGNQGIDPDDPADGTMLLARDPAAFRELFMQQRGIRLSDEANGVPCSHRYDQGDDGDQDGGGDQAGQATLTSFDTNGDLISGWYWLRDDALSHFGEWTFRDLPTGSGDLTLDITVLATDQMSGGPGFPAVVEIVYGVPGGDELQSRVETIDNTSPKTDPVGYTCHKTIVIPRATLNGGSDFFVRIERLSPGDNHVAVSADSIKVLTGAP